MVRLDFSGIGSGLPLGLEIGVYGRADALDTPHETYGAVTWDLGGGGRILAGDPRPAFDAFAFSALEAHFPALAVDRAFATRSEATYGAMFLNYLPFGVSLHNTTTDLSYAASVHFVENKDVTIASLGLGWEQGNWTLEGAIEASFGTTTDISVKAQAIGKFGNITAGLGYYAPGAAPGPDLFEAFASVSPMDRMTLSGVVQVPVNSVSDPTIGVAAGYDLNDNLGLSLGVVSDAGADAAFSTFLDWTF